ncbi:UNVERIFIED_CONTAM: hypothetical protein Scaly_2881600 [Sesamum calycinum]|uniref:Uncharacterized protein n=1 Tax=Sesamum calycinum TaxID=2727403 RepID=A0AAW2L7V5_9LAMI
MISSPPPPHPAPLPETEQCEPSVGPYVPEPIPHLKVRRRLFLAKEGDGPPIPPLQQHWTPDRGPRAPSEEVNSRRETVATAQVRRAEQLRKINEQLDRISRKMEELRRLIKIGPRVPLEMDRDAIRITFDDRDLVDILFPHNDPVVITIDVANFVVQKVLVDNDNLADIILKHCGKDGFIHDEFETSQYPTNGFGGGNITPAGVVSMLTSVAADLCRKTMMVRYLVVDIPSAYNIILGRPTLNQFQAVVSTYHLKVKFPTSNEIGLVKETRNRVRGGKFLGYKVTERGIEANLEKIKPILQNPSPRSIKDIENLAGRMGGAGIVLRDPEGIEFEVAVKLYFAVTNNEDDYEAVIAGMNLALRLRVENSRKFTLLAFEHLENRGVFQDKELHDPKGGEGLPLLNVQAPNDDWITSIIRFLQGMKLTTYSGKYRREVVDIISGIAHWLRKF